jgi:hypothetical protein
MFKPVWADVKTQNLVVSGVATESTRDLAATMAVPQEVVYFRLNLPS